MSAIHTDLIETRLLALLDGLTDVLLRLAETLDQVEAFAIESGWFSTKE